MGDVDGCRADLKKAPKDANRHYNLGLALLSSIEVPMRAGKLTGKEKGVAKEAEECFAKALEIAGNHGRAHIMIAMLYRFTKRYDEAVPHLEYALGLPKESADWWTACETLASVHMEENRHGKAAELMEEALRQRPREGLAYYKLGACYYLLNRYPEAKAVFEKGLKAVPGHPQIAAAYAELLQAMGASVPAPEAPAIPPEYQAKQKEVERITKEMMEQVTAVMSGAGTPEAKTKRVQKLQAEMQEKIKKVYGG